MCREWVIRLVDQAGQTSVIVDAGDQATVAQLRRAVAAQLGHGGTEALTLVRWPSRTPR